MRLFSSDSSNHNKVKVFFILLIMIIGSTLVFMDFDDGAALNFGNNTDLTEANNVLQGETAYNEAGRSFSISPDINGDRVDDILVGSLNYDATGLTNCGKTYVVFGGQDDWTLDKHLADSPVTFVGEHYYDSAGIITYAGDVNGDGLGDILIGAPYNDEGAGNDFNSIDGAGQVYLIFGRKSGFEKESILYDADASFLGEDAYDNVGFHISTAGDVNGDGFDDFIIGTPNKDQSGTNTGKVYLIFGKATGWDKDFDLSVADCSILGDAAGDELHLAANAGDINRDGFDDILLGSPGYGQDDSGKVYLVYGRKAPWPKNATVSNVADAAFIGEKADNYLSRVAGPGDVNGDGFDDILLGAPGNNDGGLNAGKSYLIFGQELPYSMDFNVENADASFIGENADDNCANVARAGDVNGDGFNDLSIGAPFNDKGGANAGQVYLFLGKNSGWTQGIDVGSADINFVSNQKDGNAGSIMGSYQPGDVNGDGIDDILIGEPGNSAVQWKMGQCYLFFIEVNMRPTKITHLLTFADPKYTRSIDRAELNETIYIEVRGEDQDPKRRNLAETVVTSANYDTLGITVPLKETGNNTGIFHGQVSVKELSHKSHKWIGVSIPDTVILRSVENDALLKYLPAGPRVKVEEAILIDGDGPDKNTIYCGKQSYTLKVVVNNSLGCNDLESVFVTWEVIESPSSGRISDGEELLLPEIQTIRIAWHRIQNAFEILESPEGWLSFKEPYAICLSEKNTHNIYFNMMFGWAYPEFSTSALSIRAVSNFLNDQWTNISLPAHFKFFKTINRMELVGDLSVHGEVQGDLEDGDFVLAGELLTWTGLKAIYIDPSNPATVFATPGSVKMKIQDNLGNLWTADISTDKNITLVFFAPEVQNLDVIFTISILGIPAACDLTDMEFELGITDYKPKAPTNIMLHADSYDDPNTYADNDRELHVTWNKPDSHPWEIKGYYYSITDRTVPDDDLFTEDTQGVIYLSSDYSEVNGGRVSVYVWAMDIYGAIGQAGSASIIIDRTDLEFYDATPENDHQSSSKDVTFSIMISDMGGSGVDGGHIYYHKSTTGLDGWSQWEPYGIISSGSMVMCTVTTTLDEGDDNYFQWRARDLAGNGYALSEIIHVVVDTGIKNRAPTVSLQAPENDSVVTTDSPILYWYGVDLDGDPLSYDVYFSSNYNRVRLRDNSVLVASNTPLKQFVSPMPLQSRETYYWTVIPNDGRDVGTCLMGVWSFHVDITLRTSTTELLLPHDNSILASVKPTLMWKVDYEGTGAVTITYDVYLDTVPNPTKIVASNQVENYFKPWFPLENGQTYYWKVIPYANDIKGTCRSGVWQFLVDLNFSYEINIKSQFDVLTLEQDEFKSINLFISNKGNQPDTIKLTAMSDDLKDLSFNETEIILPRFDKGIAILNIHIPDDLDEGTYKIHIRIISEGARIQGQEIEDETIITVKVIKSADTVQKEELMNLLSALGIIVIVLNIILVFSFIMNRRSRRESDRYRTLYYIHKYSRKKGGLTKPKGKSGYQRTEPIGLDNRLRMELESISPLSVGSGYSLEERLAILKYLRNTDKITEAQYKKGLVSLREKLVAKRSLKADDDRPTSHALPEKIVKDR